MKISCDIIRDLLPLYAEDMTSQASNDMVDEHLKDCAPCRDCLDDLRRPAQRPEEVSVHSLNRIKKRIQKRRVLTALLAVLLLVSLYVNVETVLDSYVYLTADQALEKVVTEDGIVKIYWKDYVSGVGSTLPDEEPNNLGIICQTRLRNLLTEKKRSGKHVYVLDKEEGFFQNSAADPETTNVWYYSYKDGKPEKLLWDAGAEYPDPDFSYEEVVHYGIAYYCIVCAILSVVLGFFAWKKRGSRAGKWLRIGSLFFGCSCIAVLCTSAGQFEHYWYDIPSDITASGIPFLPMFLTGLCAFSLHDMKEQELLSEEELCTEEERQMIRYRKILKVLTPVLAVFTLLMCLRTVGMAYVYLTPEEAAVQVIEQENGDVIIQESRLVKMNTHFGKHGYGEESYEGLLYGGYVKEVLPYRMGWTELDLEGSRTYMKKENAEKEPSYWYLNPEDGTADVCVWDNGTEKPTEPIVERDNSPAYYTLATCAAFLTFLALTVALPKQRTYLRYGTLLFGSLFVSYVLASGGEFYKFQGIYTITNKFDGSLFAAVPMFLTGTSAFLLHDLKKK